MNSPYHQRKEQRTKRYFEKVYKNKLIKCIACAGSGYYDNTDHLGNTPHCASCNGTGKVRERYQGI